MIPGTFNPLPVQFSPASLSLAAWYDPSDMTTLFQDSAATTPVTASGQSVGYMADKSGNGRHLIQATGGARPVLTVAGGISYLTLDGVNDRMTFTGVNVPVFDAICGVNITGGSTVGGLFTNNANAGTMRGGWIRNTSSWLNDGSNKFYSNSYANRTLTNSVTLSVDTVLRASPGGYGGPYRFDNGYCVGDDRLLARYMGLRLYGLIVSPAALSASAIRDCEDWMASKTGITL